MNKYIAVFVVGILVLAMVGIIAWNEYQGGEQSIGNQWKSIPHLTPTSLIVESQSSPTASHLSSVQPTLAFTNTPTQTNTSAPTTTATPAISPTPAVIVMRVSAPFGVNLRDAPSGNIIGGLPMDTLVHIYPGSEEVDGIEWVHVVVAQEDESDQFTEGWVALDNLTLVSEVPTLTP